MDEKVCVYILKCLRASDVCMQGVNTALNALIKQHRINVKQKWMNVIFAGLFMATASKVTELKTQILKMNEKIKKLEAAESEKGE